MAGVLGLFGCAMAGVILSDTTGHDVGAPPTEQPPGERHDPQLAAWATRQRAPGPEVPDREAWSPPQAAALETFESVIKRLCELSDQTAKHARDDEHEAAEALDNEARAVLATAMHRFRDAGERALTMVVELPNARAGGPRPIGQNNLLGVLQVILAAELARRHETAEKFGEPSSRDELVAAALTAMPIGSNTAEMGDRLLHQRPYLGLCHEPRVLELLRLAGQGTFSRTIATRMLLTLWENLRASGQRSSDELSHLALILLDDADPSQVIAACRQLLGDARYRTVALAWLRERGDREIAGEVARLAGRELPPAEALAVLRALSPLLQHTRGTLLAVGVRAPELLADAYREQLAAGTRPALRREMVMGVGMLPDASGLEIAQLALDHDPSVEVRLQALFVFTMHGLGVGAEAAVHQILDDPKISADPHHLDTVVLALRNLEDEDANALARLAARIRAMPLSAKSERVLDEMLARSVPSGGR